jgi:hypothetical protein
LGEIFTQRIVETGRLPLFCFFVAFIVTFVSVRISARLIRSRPRRWLRNVTAGDLHIHHMVFGVVLMLIGGVAALSIPDSYAGWYATAASVFGVGAGLMLDEFALILHVRDVYWAEEGRASIDAVFIAVAISGLILVGARPIGLLDFLAPYPGSVSLVIVANLLLNLVLAILTLLKGKIWTGLVGLFVPVLLIFSVFRLARPGSPWARWRYRPGSRRLRRALRREDRIRRPLIRAKIWVQEFIAGRHDLLPHDPRWRR